MISFHSEKNYFKCLLLRERHLVLFQLHISLVVLLEEVEVLVIHLMIQTCDGQEGLSSLQ